MPICKKCGKSKERCAFCVHATGRPRTTCTECYSGKYRENHQAYYKRNKVKFIKNRKRRRAEIQSFLRKYKHGKLCTDCKKPHPYWRLDFDHLRDKKYGLATMGRMGVSQAKLLEEINKCELVCANCHRDRTHSRRNGTPGENQTPDL